MKTIFEPPSDRRSQWKLLLEPISDRRSQWKLLLEPISDRRSQWKLLLEPISERSQWKLLLEPISDRRSQWKLHLGLSSDSRSQWKLLFWSHRLTEGHNGNHFPTLGVILCIGGGSGGRVARAALNNSFLPGVPPIILWLLYIIQNS